MAGTVIPSTLQRVKMSML